MGKQEIHPLFYPLAYKLPTRQELFLNIDKYIHEYFEKDEQLDNNLVEIIEKIKTHKAKNADWIKVYKKLLDELLQKEDNQDRIYKDHYKQLKHYLKDPIRSFVFLISNSVEEISFAEESAQFQKLFEEITRDNIVTKSEEDFLFEKANEYGINDDKLKLALENPIVANSTFKLLVDEICEDGIITETEDNFIREKAKEYNIPLETLDKLIEVSIIKHKVIEHLSRSEDFLKLISTFLLYKTLIPFSPTLYEITKKVLSFFGRQGSPKALNDVFISSIFNKLKDDLNIKVGGNLVADKRDVYEILDLLGLKVKISDLNESIVHEPNQTIFQSFQNQNEFVFDNIIYKILDVKSSNAPLFQYEVLGNTVQVKVNSSHNLHPNDTPSAKSLEYIIVCMISAKINLYDNIQVEDYFDLFEIKQKKISKIIK